MINILVLLNCLPVFEDTLGWNLQYSTRDLGDEFLARLLEAIGRFIIPQIISVLGWQLLITLLLVRHLFIDLADLSDHVSVFVFLRLLFTNVYNAWGRCFWRRWFTLLIMRGSALIILNIKAGGLVHIDLTRLLEWWYRVRHRLLVNHASRELFSFCHLQLVDVGVDSASFVVNLHFSFVTENGIK